MQPLGSVEAVAAAVREDAAAEAARITREGERACAQLEGGGALAPDERVARLAAARRAAHEKLAAEDALDARSAIEARESWMAAVVERARQRLDEPDRRSRLARMIQQAAARLGAGPLTITVAPVDVPLVDGAVADPTMTPGGVRVTAGRLTIDESVEARARRLEPKWRAALGRIWG